MLGILEVFLVFVQRVKNADPSFWVPLQTFCEFIYIALLAIP